jgi:hypothetical protein
MADKSADLLQCSAAAFSSFFYFNVEYLTMLSVTHTDRFVGGEQRAGKTKRQKSKLL